jgi:hypothetical protein
MSAPNPNDFSSSSSESVVEIPKPDSSFTFESIQSRMNTWVSSSQDKKHKLDHDDNEDKKQDEVQYEPVKMCKICLERPIGTVLLNCGHAVMCTVCGSTANLAKMQMVCPVCRADVRECKRIFFA